MSQEESEHNEVDGMKKGVDSIGEVIQGWCQWGTNRKPPTAGLMVT